MRVSESGPVLTAGLINLLAVFWMVASGIGLTGRLTYPLDDAYTHLAIADRVLHHGVWGVNVGQSVSASASPLWTSLLVIAGGLGLPLEWMPLVLNIFASLALLIGIDLALRHAAVPAVVRTVGMLGMIATLPLPWLTVIGMEHVLHAAGCVWFLLAVRNFSERRWRSAAIVLAALLPLIRFESLFLIGAAALVTSARSKRDAAILAIAGSSLTIVFAAVSLVNGWMWLPNSVLLQADGWTSLLPLVEPTAWQAWLSLGVVSGMLLGLALLHLDAPQPLRFNGEAVIVLLTAHLQIILIAGRFTRYDGFLYALVTVAYLSTGWEVMTRLWRVRPLTARHLALAVAIALPLLGFLPTRGAARDRVLDVPLTMAHVTNQQREAARFVREFLTVPGPVAVSDLGLMAFESGRPVVDLIGRADTEMARALLRAEMTPALLDQLLRSRGAATAVVSTGSLDRWTNADPPSPSWVRIGQLQALNDRAGKSPIMIVYAIDASLAATVRSNFTAFADTLTDRSIATVYR